MHYDHETCAFACLKGSGLVALVSNEPQNHVRSSLMTAESGIHWYVIQKDDQKAGRAAAPRSTVRSADERRGKALKACCVVY